MGARSVSRREAIKVLAGGTGALAFGPVIIRTAMAAGKITMAQFSPFTGGYAYAGPAVEKGMRLALKERNYEILGNKIEFITRDTETKPAVGVRRLSEAISTSDVKYFAGNFSSAVGLAQSEIAKQNKVFQYAAGGSEDFAGSKCSRYTFQWSASPYTALKVTMDYVMKEMPNAKRWYAITHDYVFGHALYKYAKIVGDMKGISWVGNDLVPLGERQYTQYLTKVVAAKPDVLCLLIGGQDAATCTRQFHGYGTTRETRIVGPWALEVDQLRELSPEMREGLILGQNYYHGIDTPVNREFVRKFQAEYNASPGYASGYGYDAFRTILLAMDKAKSVKVQDVITAMEGMTYEGLLGTTSIDPKTHQTIRPYFVVLGKQQSKMKDPEDYADIVYTAADPQPKEYNECKDLGPL
jgi:branched-chain amino acid transport system substrate-binding protein